MKIGTKLTIGYLFAALLVAAVGLVGLRGILGISGSFNEILESTSKEVPTIEKASAQFFKMQLECTSAVAVLSGGRDGSGRMAAVGAEFAEADSTAKRLVALYLSFTPGFNDPIAADLDRVRTEHERIFQKIADGQDRADGGLTGEVLADLAAVEALHRENVARALNIETKFGLDEAEEANAVVVRSKWLIGGLGLLAAALAVLLGQFLAKNISRPIALLTAATERLGRGDYLSKVEIRRSDEVGQLASAFNQMVGELEHTKIIEAQKLRLEQLNAELKSKNDALDGFVYRVSHDLKAPIVNISSLTGLVQKMWPAPDARLGQALSHIAASAAKLQHTVLDLLELSRLEKGLEKTRETIDLAAALDGVRAALDLGGASVEGDFGAAPEVFYPKIDVESILSNLVGNAVKYARPGVAAQVRVSSSTTLVGTCLTVSDNGLGIDLKKDGAKLFGMFQRFHDHVEGSGIGLYIVRKLVEGQGGRIEVESAVGRGSTFRVFLNEKLPAAGADMPPHNFSLEKHRPRPA